MSRPKKANFADFDSREFLSIAEGVALWAGREPLDNHKLYSDLTALKRKIQEVFFVLGFRSDKNPNSFPRYYESAPLYGWVQVAEYMEERPAFLYPDERGPKKEKRLGSDLDVEIYKAVNKVMEMRNCERTDAYEHIRSLGHDGVLKPRQKKTAAAVESADKRGKAEYERTKRTEV